MAVDREGSFHVQFEGMSVAEANRAASELRGMIERAAGRDVRTEIVKERSDTQDFGATLVLVLGTPAVVVLAKAIHSYIAKRGDRVVIRTAQGTLVATGQAARNIDVAKTAAAMRSAIDDR